MNRPLSPLAGSIRRLAWLLAAALGLAAAAQTVPAGGIALVNGDVATAGSFYANNGSNGTAIATRTLVDVTGQNFTRAARIATLAPTGDFWSSAVTMNANRAVADNDVVLIRFFLRAIETTDESGQVTCQLYVEGPAPSYTKSVSTEIRAGLEWTEYFVPFEVEGAHASGTLGIKFGVGATVRPQVLELGGVEVLWYGKSRTLAEMPRTSFQYDGRSLTAPWRAEAGARIERHRKGTYTVRVVNSAGQPVPGATVRIRQRRHAFEFGTAIDGRRIVNTTDATNATYRAKLLELFNAGTLENDLKWQPWIGEWGSSYNRNVALGALQWAQTNQLRMRGHVLVWPSTRNMPASLTAKINASDPSIPTTILEHIDDIVTATRAYLNEWDVLNEPYDNHDIMDRYGNALMADWFNFFFNDMATCEIYINDYAILSGGGLYVAKQDAYEATIRTIRDAGGPLTGIGFQGHFGGAPTGVPRMWTILQRYATAFPDVGFRITEFDFVTDDEALQADFTRDFYTLAFSHPQMRGIQMWGFWAGAHWRSEAALYTTDWRERPNAAAYRQLVFGDWWTDVTTSTSATGQAAGRGFLGSYVAEVAFGGASAAQNFDLAAGGAEVTVTLNLPTGVPTITTQPLGAAVLPGSPVTLSVAAAGSGTLTYQWRKNGIALAGSTAPTLTLPQAQASDTGTYSVAVSGPGGTTISDAAIVGVLTTAKVDGGGNEVGTDIVHPNKNVYDQVLVTGTAVTIKADAGQVTRTSFLDLTDDIVQVEFSGPGSLTLELAAATGPAAPTLYHQPTVAYMKGHATITIVGANENSHVSVFTVGTKTAVNQALFRAATHYDGVADLARLSIHSTNGRFGRVGCANVEFGGTAGLVGLWAPGVDFAGPVYLHNLSAADAADPVLVTGSIATGSIGITGGDMAQPNGRPVRIGSVARIEMRAGETSHAVPQPAQLNRAAYERNGQDVTAAIVVDP